MMDRPVSTAVVGLGYWGPNLARNLQELPEAKLVAVCDTNSALVSKVVQRYPSVRGVERIDELLEDETIEAIVIATPVSTHFDLAAAALTAGKHVMVEKPLAGSTEEGLALLELAANYDRLLMPGHTFLYSPPVNAVKDLIQSGELGDIYFISTSRVNLGLHQTDVSVAWDLGPHDFSILRYWLDETPNHVSAMSRSCVIPTIPDVAFINLEFPSGTIAHAELAWLAPSKLRRTTVVGSRKMVMYDDTSNEPVRIFDTGVDLPDPETFGEYRLSYRTGSIVSPYIKPAEPLYLELEDFCSSIRDGSVPRSSSLLGFEVIRMIEAVEESFALEGARVAIDSLGAIPHAA